MLQKIENTCQSTRTSDLSFELNSYIVYSHRDFFFGSPPNLLQQQNRLYYICTQESILKSFLTFKPQFRDVGWPHFLQLGKFEMPHMTRQTNTQSCCVYGIYPSTLLLGRNSTPLYGQRKKPDHLHTDLKRFLLNSKVYLSCIWKWVSVRGKYIEPDSFLQWLPNQMSSFPLLQRSWHETVHISPVITNVILTRKFIVHLLVT